MNDRYNVHVGNIGFVYNGNSVEHAEQVYSDYVHRSRNSLGRAGNEHVILFENGEIEKEYRPNLEDDFEKKCCVKCGKRLEMEDLLCIADRTNKDGD